MFYLNWENLPRPNITTIEEIRINLLKEKRFHKLGVQNHTGKTVWIAPILSPHPSSKPGCLGNLCVVALVSSLILHLPSLHRWLPGQPLLNHTFLRFGFSLTTDVHRGWMSFWMTSFFCKGSSVSTLQHKLPTLLWVQPIVHCLGWACRSWVSCGFDLLSPNSMFCWILFWAILNNYGYHFTSISITIQKTTWSAQQHRGTIRSFVVSLSDFLWTVWASAIVREAAEGQAK